MIITDISPLPMVKVLGEKLVAYKKPAGVSTTLELAGNKQAIFETAQKLIEYGIDVLVLGCTGYSTIQIAKELKQKFGIPVIDPVVAAGFYAYFTK